LRLFSRAQPPELGNGRLTNLQTLTVDTSWYFRYRSTQNPDLGAKFPQLLNIVEQTAIPLQNNYAQSTIQAIANIAGIHFAYIEQGGSSLYPILALKASSLEVLRILISIGGVEIDHFSLWHDKMGNAVAQPLAPLVDPGTGLTFPNFNDPGSQHNAMLSAVDQQAGSQMFQTNLIQPEPCQFISPDLPPCSTLSVLQVMVRQRGGKRKALFIPSVGVDHHTAPAFFSLDTNHMSSQPLQVQSSPQIIFSIQLDFTAQERPLCSNAGRCVRCCHNLDLQHVAERGRYSMVVQLSEHLRKHRVGRNLHKAVQAAYEHRRPCVRADMRSPTEFGPAAQGNGRSVRLASPSASLPLCRRL
jgi:hypothetical protein